MNFPAIWKSGYVTRFHANPDVPAETLAEHHARVAQILFAICQPSTELIFAALHHDCGELIVGDLPWPFKRANPELAAMHREAEDRALTGILGRSFRLSEREAGLLRLADRIAAHLYGERHSPGPDWERDWIEVHNQADRLGVSLDAITGAAE
jgi:5'-deoxynucleotidase YfbR-like HD superfamily hydrolase